MKRFMIQLFLVLILLSHAACAPAAQPEEGTSYKLYYPVAQLGAASGEDALVTREVSIEGAEQMNVEELAEQLLNRLLAEAPDEQVVAPVRGAFVNDVSVAGQWAQVDFSHSYGNLTGLDLTLADYCVTLTLTQLEGINAVSITADGRTLPQRGDRVLVAADALLATTEQARRPVTVNLYFYDTANNSLRAERRALELYEGQTRTGALLQALTEGPEDETLQAVLPEDFVVLASYVEGGTCYLNLPADIQLGDHAELALSSLVESLCSLSLIEQVQIVLDGELSEKLCGVSIAEPLRSNRSK